MSESNAGACGRLVGVLLGAVVLVLGVGGMGGCATQDTTVLLTRHAEVASSPGQRDPGLSPAGLARAEALSKMSETRRVKAIYVSPYRRTQQTADATAKRRKVDPQVVPLAGSVESRAKSMAADIRELQANRTTLVVGHSNTIPALIKALGAEAPVIGEEDFGELFIVVIDKDGLVTVRSVRYGDGE